MRLKYLASANPTADAISEMLSVELSKSSLAFAIRRIRMYCFGVVYVYFLNVLINQQVDM